jgi:DNA recombination protein RmuC
MDKVLLVIADTQVTVAELVLGALAASLVVMIWLMRQAQAAHEERVREAAGAAERQRELDEKIAALLQVQAEMTGRMAQIGETFDTKQTNLARLIGERIENLQARVGEGLHANLTSTHENMTKLGERLVVIDEAQKRMSDLTSEMLSLKAVLSNKQARGAFGQGRMEAIVRDALPLTAYEFQATLANRTRPDCVIRLPGDPRPLVVDAKFPLEGFTQFREAQTEDERRLAAQRVKTDLGAHIKDIAEKYVAATDTQDIAILFVPAESIYADLQEHFEDVVHKAHRARILIVSPSLLTMAIQVMQSIVRDNQMREQAHVIQGEVRKLLDDVNRLRDRVGKLDTHFRQAQEDVTQITTSADKIARRGERIDAMDFEAQAVAARAADPAIPAPRPELPAAE